MTWPIIKRSGYRTISAALPDGTYGSGADRETDTAGTVTFPVGSAAGASLRFNAVTGSLAGKIYVCYDGTGELGGSGTFHLVPCVDGDGTPYAANATITATANMKLTPEAVGITHIRFVRASGTSATVQVISSFGAFTYFTSLLKQLFGTSATSLGKAEDAAHASGDVGVMSLGVRNDADAALSGTDLDYTPIATDAKGAVKTINPLTIVAVTFTPPAATLAANDIIADTQEIAGAVRTNAGYSILDTIIIDDEDDQGVAMDIVFFSANTSLGSEDSAVSISDANSRTILGIVSVSNSDFIDLTANRTATLRNVGLTVQGATGSTSIYAGLVTRGTPTYTTAGITARFGFKQA